MSLSSSGASLAGSSGAKVVQKPCLLNDEAVRRAEFVSNGDSLGVFLSRNAVSSVYRGATTPVFQVYNMETGKLEKEEKITQPDFGAWLVLFEFCNSL